MNGITELAKYLTPEYQPEVQFEGFLLFICGVFFYIALWCYTNMAAAESSITR
jgi:hypothetical protein